MVEPAPIPAEEDESDLFGPSEGDMIQVLPEAPQPRRESVRPSAAFLSALAALGSASPQLQAAVRQAESAGRELRLVFKPEIQEGLRRGTLHLLQTSDGALPTAVNASSKIVGRGRIAGSLLVARWTRSGRGQSRHSLK